MKRFPTACLFAVVFLAAAGEVRAQVRPAIDVNFILGLPQGEFGEHVDAVGFGGTIFGGIGLRDAPLMVGLELGGMIYGFDRRKERFPNVPEVTIDVETSNNIVMGHLVFRLQPASGVVRPYVDGLVGLKYLYTETSIESERNHGDQPFASSTNFDDVAFSYGAGGGLDLRIFNGPLGEERHPVAIAINLGVRYLFGSEAEYLKEGSIRRVGDDVAYDVERSRTDLLVPQLGVRFNF